MTNQDVDCVNVGPGSAGATLAGRLSEDPAVTVCLLEAGGPDTGVLIDAPLGLVAMLPTKINNWAFETVPQKGLNGARVTGRGAAMRHGLGGWDLGPIGAVTLRHYIAPMQINMPRAAVSEAFAAGQNPIHLCKKFSRSCSQAQ